MMDKEILLLKYFDGSLSEEEKVVFNQFLEEDDEFKSQFLLEKDVQAVIREENRIGLKKKLQRFETERETVSTGNKRTWWKPLSIAASIILLLGASWLLFNSNAFNGQEQLFANNYEKYPNTVYTITRSDVSDDSLERMAFEAYETNNYDAAIEYLLDLKEKTRLDYVDFYLGQSYLANENYLKAIDRFQEIIEINSEFKQEAYWYAALANLKLDQNKEAKQLLEELVQNKKYKFKEASELLKKLD